MKASPINITIIQIYAPTSTYNDEENEQFYETVDNTIQESHKKDMLIVQGDFNANIGSNANEEWAECAGRFGIGVRKKPEITRICWKTQTGSGEYIISTQKVKVYHMALS